jgi:hypothetical protein
MTVTVLRRNDVAPWRRMPDRVLVLTGDEVHSLRGLAADVWIELSQPMMQSELLERLGCIGDAPITADGGEEVVAMLLELDVIRRNEVGP